MSQLLRDPSIQPTEAVFAEGLGDAFGAFAKFTEGLKAYCISLMEWQYYKDAKAWLSKGEYKWITSRGTNKIKPIFWLSIWEGFFRVLFFFSPDRKNELMCLPISDFAKASIENACPMGKTMRIMPVILDVTSVTQLVDIYELAQFRKISAK